MYVCMSVGMYIYACMYVYVCMYIIIIVIRMTYLYSLVYLCLGSVITINTHYFINWSITLVNMVTTDLNGIICMYSSKSPHNIIAQLYRTSIDCRNLYICISSYILNIIQNVELQIFY